MQKEIMFENIKTVFFDYDGTLHNSIRIYGPAFRKAYQYLVDSGLTEDREWSDAEISYWLGYSPPEMWKEFMPSLDERVRNKCSAIIGEEMKNLTEKGKALLYDGALDILKYLQSKGYRLVFISNCKTAYKDTHSNLFGLNEFFSSLVCSEDYDYIPKSEILRYIKKQHDEEMVIVGDRAQDIDAGKNNNIYTIGCSYGFGLKGELDCADVIISDIRDLMKYL